MISARSAMNRFDQTVDVYLEDILTKTINQIHIYYNFNGEYSNIL